MKEYSYRREVLLIGLVFLLGLFAVNSYAQFGGGSGTGVDPYLIGTATHLNNIRGYLDSHFRQTANINLSPGALQDQVWYDQIRGWNPIGDITTPFAGSYDGDVYTISNLTMSRPDTENSGLFGVSNGAIFTDIGFINAQIYGRSYLGALTGRHTGGSVTRCYHEGGWVGGSRLGPEGVGARIGGLIGQATATVIQYCYSTADAFGWQYQGSLVGFFGTGLVSDCYATGSATLGRIGSGGMFGYISGGANARIENCYSVGRVTTGAPGQDSWSGGFTGYTNPGGVLVNTYFNSETCGRGTYGGNLVPAGLDRTTAQMVQQEGFPAFDFENIWAISPGTYPYLRWQGAASSINRPGPVNLTAAGGNGVVHLTWEAPPVGEPQTFRVYRNGTLLANVAHTILQYSDATAQNGTLYEYRVSYVNAQAQESAFSHKAVMMPAAFAGAGTEDDPFVVNSAIALQAIKYYPNQHFRQSANINMSEITDWQTIGLMYHEPFTGTYNGSGFTISNLTMRTETGFYGLFGHVLGGSITSVHMENVDFEGRDNIGSLVGYLQNGSVFNSSATGRVIGYNNIVGGLIGFINASGVGESSFIGEVRGLSMVGGLAGYKGIAGNYVRNCFSVGEVEGTTNVGGLIGQSLLNEIIDSYSTANVAGISNVGGFVGNHQSGNITNCYSTGFVRGGATTGGFIGNRPAAATVVNSYWNTQTSGQEASNGGEGRTTAQLMQRDNFIEWNFDTIWNITQNQTYPYLRWQQNPGEQNIPGPNNLTATPGNLTVALAWQHPQVGQPLRYQIYRNGQLLTTVNYPTNQYADNAVTNFVRYTYYIVGQFENDVQSAPSNMVWAVPYRFEGGDGSEEQPYQVATPNQLNHIRYMLGNHFIQVASIDLDVAPFNTGNGWVPIGTITAGNRFTGSYNGDGFTISNLYFSYTTNYLGLFAYAEGARFSNMILLDVSITGGLYVAPITGMALNSSFSNCFVSGSVIGSTIGHGAIAGSINSTTITNCYSTAIIRGSRSLGGIVGMTANNSSVVNCYFSGEVYGGSTVATQGVGGLVGANGAGCTISGSYVNGYVGATGFAGGLVGTNLGAVIDSYWNYETTSFMVSAGGTPKNTAQMIQLNTYEEWDFAELWSIQNNESYPWLRWQGEIAEHNFPNHLLPPVNLQGLPSNNQANLIWDAPSFGPAPNQYKIYRDGSLQGIIPGAIREYEQAGLENYRNYNYTVSAVYVDVESNPARVAVFPFMGFAGGAGTPENPYLIADARQLNDIRLSNYRTRYFRQIANIDLAEYENWEPLAGSAAADQFFGSYDGGGFEIANLTININATYRGLFGYLNNATIQNLNLTDVNITGGQYTGAIAGRAQNSTIINCSVSGAINGTSTYIGGFFGYVGTGTIRITDCEINVTVRGTGNYVGGLLGYATTETIVTGIRGRADVRAPGMYVGGISSYSTGNSTFIDCVIDAQILTSNTHLGGLIGYALGNTIVENCATTGNVETTTATAASYTGGLLGRVSGTAQIRSSYSSASVTTATDLAGGLIGHNTCPLSDSYFIGAVTGRSSLGGLVGQQAGGSITNSYSTGRIRSDVAANVGGLVGINTGTVTDCYWDTERSNIGVSAAGEPRNTGEMTFPYDGNTYARWDFEEMWVADQSFVPDVNPGANDGYPYLYWQFDDRLDTPEVRISVDNQNRAVLRWEAIEGANSYRVYSSLNPNLPIAQWTYLTTTAATQYVEAEAMADRNFFRVIASADEE